MKSPHGLSGAEVRILAALTRAADAGQTCPTNPDLSVITGGSISGPVKIMQGLEAKGLIHVERFSCGREVTIVASGRTALHTGSRVPRSAAAPGAPAQAPTGAELVDALRAAAVRRGQTTSDLAKPLAKQPASFLDQLGRSVRPKAATVARVRAVIAGEDPGPAPATNSRRSALKKSATSLVDSRLAPQPDAPIAERVDRDPCVMCGVRTDIGCHHTRSAAPATPPPPPPPLVERAAPAGKRPRTFEEQLAAVRAGARLVERVPLPSRPQLRTLGGVASGML